MSLVKLHTEYIKSLLNCLGFKKLQGKLLVQCDDKTLLKYVYYILQWKQQDIYKFARGNAQPHIYEPQIYKFLIPIPEDENIIKSVVEKCQEVDSVKNSKDEYKLSEKRKIINEMLGMDI